MNPVSSGARLRIRPTPVTGPIPSTNVAPKYACIDRNEPIPTWTSAHQRQAHRQEPVELAGRLAEEATGRPAGGSIARRAEVASSASRPR